MAVSSVENSAILNNYINSQASAASKSSSSTSSSSTSSSTGSSASLWGNFNTYLKLLSAQLANQDPTQPMDASQFTQQLVQYAGIEQQISTNSKLDSISSLIGSNSITPLLSYVGQYVEAPADGSLVVQGGSAKMAYTLPSEATSTKIYVKDGKGNVVATMDGVTTKGLNRAVWDGTLDAGGKASDGVYSFSIVAKDSQGKAMDLTDIRIIGQVTGIETGSDGKAVLKVGNKEIKDTKVLSIFGGISTASTTNGTNSSSSSNTASS